MARTKRSKPEAFAPSKRRKLDDEIPQSSQSVFSGSDKVNPSHFPGEAPIASFVGMASAGVKESSQIVRDNARAIFGGGLDMDAVSDHDVFLAATPTPLPTDIEKLSEEKEKEKKYKAVTAAIDLAVRRAVMHYCASFLATDLTACGLFKKGMTPAPPPAVCYILRYRTSQAASEASAKIRQRSDDSVLRLSDGQVISLRSIGTKKWAKRSLIGKLLVDDLDEAQFTEAMSGLGLPKSPNIDRTSTNSSQLVLTEADGPEQILRQMSVDIHEATVGGAQPARSNSELQVSTVVDTHNGILKQNERLEIIDLTLDDQVEISQGDNSVTMKRPMNFRIDSLDLSNSIRLCDLSKDERMLQARYWGITHDLDLALCPICTMPGHMFAACPSRTCKHCGLTDAHFLADCPARRKCSKCGERGHEITQCPVKLTHSAEEGLDCDLCHGNHKEDECAWVWRTFNPADVAPEKLSKAHWIDMSCYECGSTKHWGDDCQALSKLKARASTNDTFSAKFANDFHAQTSQNRQQFSIRGLAQQSLRNGSGETAALNGRASFPGSLPLQPSIEGKAGKRRPPQQANARKPNQNKTSALNTSTNRTPGDQYRTDYRFVPMPDQQPQNSRAIDQARDDRYAQDYRSRRAGFRRYDDEGRGSIERPRRSQADYRPR